MALFIVFNTLMFFLIGQYIRCSISFWKVLMNFEHISRETIPHLLQIF